MKLLSIIIPIYNVKNYLEKAIQSALDQEIDDFEVILVDDGSVDGCYNICEKYRGYSNVKIIHKENGGLVSARKAGLRVSTGEYISFLDGDDWVDKTYYSNMVNSPYFRNADIICSGYTKSYVDIQKAEVCTNRIDSGKYDKNIDYDFNTKVLYSGSYYEYGIIPTVWSKIVKRDKLEKWLEKVPDIITVGEDVACIMPILFDSDYIVVDNTNVGYHYRCTGSSMSRSFPKGRTNEVKEMLEYLRNIICLYNNPILENQYYIYFSFLIKHVIKGTAIEMDDETLTSFSREPIVHQCINRVSIIKSIPFRYRIMYIFLKNHYFKITLCYYRFVSFLTRK